jgi:AraC-like DNA-binding protein
MTPSLPSRSAVFPAGLAGVIDLDDFDAIRNVSPEWDQVHYQIGRGRVRLRVAVAQTSEMQVAFVSRSPGVRVQGTPPRGATVLAVSLRGARLHLQGVPWERNLVAVLPEGVEFVGVAPAPHAELSVAVSSARLEEVALDRWSRSFPTSSSGPCLRLRDDGSRNAILATCARWIRAGRRNPDALRDRAIAARMEAEILRAFVDGIDPAAVGHAVRPRQALVRRADAYLRASLQEQISLADLCAALGASSRAVHAAFQNVYGIPPKAYWKALRLSSARGDLQRARPGTTVSEIAARWGFFQFGYFAVDYRRMFGEMPRETLQRAIPPNGGERITSSAGSPC